MQDISKRQERWLTRDPLNITWFEKVAYDFFARPLIIMLCRFFGIFWGFKVSYPGGMDKKAYKLLLEDWDAPLMFYSNHVSWRDTLFEPVAVDNLGYRIYMVNKIELFKYPVLDRIMWIIGGRPIVRGSSAGFRNIIKIIKAKKPIFIYPQGTRSKKHGKIMPMQEGVALLANKYEVILVPITISGLEISFGVPRRSTAIGGGKKEKLEYMASKIGVPIEKK